MRLEPRNFTVPANGDAGITVTLSAYTAGDVVGGLLTFDVARVSDRGFIERVRLVDEDSQDEPYLLYVFREQPTTIANDAAFAPTVADIQKLLFVISISTATTVNSIDFWHSAQLNYAFNAPDGNLYGYLVANASTPDYANADALSLYLDVRGDA